MLKCDKVNNVDLNVTEEAGEGGHQEAQAEVDGGSVKCFGWESVAPIIGNGGRCVRNVFEFMGGDLTQVPHLELIILEMVAVVQQKYGALSKYPIDG